MITNNTYYKGEIYIPQAKPSISDGATDSDSDFSIMLGTYEEDCLIKCLGVTLYRELAAEFDFQKSNLLKDAADVKWDKLVNGDSYSKLGETKTVYWKGLRFKSPLSNSSYNASLLAYYFYWHYERRQHISNTETGHIVQDNANASIVAPTQKVTYAWNKFVELVQGLPDNPLVYHKGGAYGGIYGKAGLLGVDYYTGDKEITLYEYINDMNDIAEDTYAEFQPRRWETTNRFGL